MKTCLVSVCGVFKGKEEKGRGNHLRQERHGITLGCGKGHWVTIIKTGERLDSEEKVHQHFLSQG